MAASAKQLMGGCILVHMPELPEVETIKLGLAGLLPGKRVAAVRHDWLGSGPAEYVCYRAGRRSGAGRSAPVYSKSFPNTAVDVERFLINAAVTDVKRRGKVILIELSSHHVLAVHLKMTGQLVYVNGARRFGAGHPSDSLIGNLPDRSTRVVFEFSDESRLFFNDQRRFGWVRLVSGAEVFDSDFMKRLGPEPLDASFSASQFRERFTRRGNTSIKAALLDQSVIAGVGNIYADEALWRAKIYPGTTVRQVSAAELNKLFKELKAVLSLGIERGGSTDKNYVNAAGEKGNYLSYANVFRRERQPCGRCAAIIEKTRVAGRGTHYCPKCQKP